MREELRIGISDIRRSRMKKIVSVFAMVSILTIISPAGSFAQGGMKWRGSGGWGMGAPYSRMYDPKTVETINGEVISVDKITPGKGMSYGVHLMVRTEKETLSVHLGPGWFIENQDVKIEPKDKIEIRGSRITFEGKPALIAAELKKGNEVLKLRDDNGIPVWSGWRRR
jgi:hypothetical protein